MGEQPGFCPQTITVSAIVVTARLHSKKTKTGFHQHPSLIFLKCYFTFVLWRKRKAGEGVGRQVEKGAKRNLTWEEWVGDQRVLVAEPVGESQGSALWEQSASMQWGQGPSRGRECPATRGRTGPAPCRSDACLPAPLGSHTP